VQINKCDRCGRIVANIVQFGFQNWNVTEQVETMFGMREAPLVKTYELCYDCGRLVVHWLAHQENELKKTSEVGRKSNGRERR